MSVIALKLLKWAWNRTVVTVCWNIAMSGEKLKKKPFNDNSLVENTKHCYFVTKYSTLYQETWLERLFIKMSHCMSSGTLANSLFTATVKIQVLLLLIFVNGYCLLVKMCSTYFIVFLCWQVDNKANSMSSSEQRALLVLDAGPTHDLQTMSVSVY